MGNWQIVVRGMGCHHNVNNPTDVDRMAKEFVDKLTNAGHVVSDAVFTSGSATKLAPTKNDAQQAALSAIAAVKFSPQYKDLSSEVQNEIQVALDLSRASGISQNVP